MARKRMIDPDSWTDEKVAELDLGPHLLWLGLISLADDEGRLEWSSRQLRIRLFPVKKGVTLAHIQAWMKEIVGVGLVSTYTVSGTEYAHHPSWKRHQYVNRATPSRIPNPPEPKPKTTHSRNTANAVSPHVQGSESQVPLESESESESESDSDSDSSDSLRSSAEIEYEIPPFPLTLPAVIPDAIAELKRLSVSFLAAFCNATTPEAIRKHGPAYADTLAALRGRGCSTADAWRAFGDTRKVNNGKPLFGASAKKVLSHVQPSRRLTAVPSSRGSDFAGLTFSEKLKRDPGYVGTPPIEGIL